MSYRITEAERKHVAAIEDVKINLQVTAEEGTTPAVNLTITDNDLLDLSAQFPQYAIDVDKTDDEHSRFRVVDAKTRETILKCEGLTSLNGNPMGLGWRYGLEFILDDDGYIKGISLVNKNNGNRNDKAITKIADLEIKSITIPENDNVGLTVNSKAIFTKAVSIETNSTDSALNVKNEQGKHAVIGDVQFTDEFALKTEGDTRLANISTDDIELVEDDSEVSITAKRTTFKDTEIDLSGVEIEGNNTTRISHLKRLSTKQVAADEVNVGTVNATTVNASTEKVNNLNAGTVNSTNVNTVNENVQSLNATNVSSDNITTENVTVFGKTRLEGDTYARALDVDGKVIAGRVKATENIETPELNATNIEADKIVTNKAEIAVADVITEKANSIETRNLNVTRQMDALKVNSRTDVVAGRDVVAGNGVITDLIKSKDNSVIAEKAGDDTIILGNIHNQTVIKTCSDPSKSQLEEEYGHVKAVVDGVEVYLANLKDVKSDKFDGYVNRSTNQDISGVKTFNDVLVAPAGIGIKDEEGHLRGIISHVKDYTDIAFKQNPKFTEAQKEADAYDELKANYDHLKLDYKALKELKKSAEEAEKALENAEEALTSEREDDKNLKEEKANLNQQIAEWEEGLSNAKAELTNRETQLSELQATVNAYTQPYIKYKSDVDNELADSEIMSIALRETLYFGRDFDDSFLKDNADYKYLSNEINCTNLPYAEALEAFDKMVAILDILSESTQDNVVSYCEVTKEHIINTLRPTIENNHANLVNARDRALAALNLAKDDVSAFENGELADAQKAITAHTTKLNALKSSLAQVESDIDANTYEIQKAESKAELAQEDKTEKDVDYSTAKTVFESNYKLYAEKIPFKYTDEMIENGELIAPEMSELVKELKNNEIPQTDYGPSDTIHLGNSEDTLKVMSKGLHSGEGIDQHIQATIDGHDHILANTDDLVAKNVMAAFDVRYVDEHTGKEMIEKGKIVGDVTTKPSEGNGASLVIGQAPVITGYEGQVLPEDQERPSKVEKEIKIVSEDDTVVISSDEANKINLSVGPIADKLNKAYNGVKFQEESSIVMTKEDGNDELLFISTSDDISFEVLSDNIMDINMNNFYNTESVLKDDILKLYDNVQPRDLRKVPNAFDVKVLMDACEARIDVLAKNLEERLPIAPNEAGRYFLVANVRNNIQGETTATYTWDGTGSLPEVHVPMSVDEIKGPEDYDADGNLYVPYEAPEYAEYMLKMRVIKTQDSLGNTVYSPRTMWVRMDKGSSDYSDTWLILKNHPAVKAAVESGRDETEAIRALLSKIDSDSDIKVTFKLYDFSKRNWAENGNTISSCFTKAKSAVIGSTLKDIEIDFNKYNAIVIEDNKDDSVNYALFAGRCPLDKTSTLYDMVNNATLRMITSETEAAEFLVSDGSMVGLIDKSENIEDELEPDNKIRFTVYDATGMRGLESEYAGEYRDDCPSTVKSAKIGSTLKDVIDFDNYHVYVKCRRGYDYEYGREYYYLSDIGNDNLFYLNNKSWSYSEVEHISTIDSRASRYMVEDGSIVIIVHK